MNVVFLAKNVSLCGGVEISGSCNLTFFCIV